MSDPIAPPPKTYAFCPSLGQGDSSTYRDAVSSYLAAHGYTQIDNDASGDATPGLLVIAPHAVPKASHPRLRKDDLRVFQELLGGLVLHIDPTSTDAPARTDSVFAFGNRRCDDDRISVLRDWLKKASQKERQKGAVDPKEALGLAIKTLGLPDEKRLLEEIRELFGLEYAKEPSQPHWWDLLHALRHVAASYDVVEHDLNRDARHPFDPFHGPEALARLHKQRELLNTANDFWKSLEAASAFRMAQAVNANPRRILVVDDNPEGIKDEIVKMVQCLMSDHEVWCWNPNENDEARDVFGYLRAYNSMIGAEKDRDGTEKESRFLDIKGEMATQWDPQSAKLRLRRLDDILKESSFVLVDLLFRIGGKEEEYGVALIRGLRRYAVDHPKKENDKPFPPPSFIAFSRSDDLDKIQKALRAGASGYVLKNRLLGLPAELARLRLGTGQDGCPLHRNFRALDTLPNETKSLLHEVRIPPIRFDRPKYTPQLMVESGEQRMARLLRAIPKPDLHLHVGSCMTPEFLVIASILMLAERHAKMLTQREPSESTDADTSRTPLLDAIPALFGFWSSKGRKLRLKRYSGEDIAIFEACFGPTPENPDPVDVLGKIIRCALMKEVRREARMTTSEKANGSLRSVLHAKLEIRDHWSVDKVEEELDKKDAVSLMLFAITCGEVESRDPKKAWSGVGQLSKDDVLRLLILFLASQYHDGEHRVVIGQQDFQTPLKEIRQKSENDSLNERDPDIKVLGERLACMIGRNNKGAMEWPDSVSLDVSLGSFRDDLLSQCPTNYAESPLEFLIASGTRGRSLAEYLAGCEYAGAKHLQRPLLMTLYARQTLEYLVRHGVLYAELRSAASGYASKDTDENGMTYQEACTTFYEAFSDEQKRLMEAYRKKLPKATDTAVPNEAGEKKEWAWCVGGEVKDVWSRVFANNRSAPPLDRLFPSKVNLIFTGKRHKATREMLMEAAAGVILSSESKSDFISASAFTDENMTRCRVVGFDLAGLEESFPPDMFRALFEQLSRMHIPITAHAGENASARFVESAVLDLRARRLGHGLALADDDKLMARVREERICIELCPVSNYQTNEFAAPKEGREYPLKKFYEYGNIVCLNTDNPIVSYTNIVKEFFQASHAYGGDGLPLWDALRMIRMGFVHAFMGLAERRALIELVEQMIFDLLNDSSVVDLLRSHANEAATKRGGK